MMMVLPVWMKPHSSKKPIIRYGSSKSKGLFIFNCFYCFMIFFVRNNVANDLPK